MTSQYLYNTSINDLMIMYVNFLPPHQIVVPIRNQVDLNQAVELMDRNPNAKSLRIYLSKPASSPPCKTTSSPSSNKKGSRNDPGMVLPDSAVSRVALFYCLQFCDKDGFLIKINIQIG